MWSGPYRGGGQGWYSTAYSSPWHLTFLPGGLHPALLARGRLWFLALRGQRRRHCGGSLGPGWAIDNNHTTFKISVPIPKMFPPGCNGTVPSGYSPDGVMTTSDDGSSSIGMVDTMVGEGGGRDNDKISKSPFYWHNHAQENQVHHPYHHLSYG